MSNLPDIFSGIKKREKQQDNYEARLLKKLVASRMMYTGSRHGVHSDINAIFSHVTIVKDKNLEFLSKLLV